MLGFIVALISSVLCAIVYVRMYRREVPEPIGKKSAALPVVLGIFAPLLATLLLALISITLLKVTGGKGLGDLTSSLVVRSLLGAFVSAGFTEELVKLVLFLITVRIVKPKNVYECAFLCAGVGFGFTALEDILYGGGNVMVAVSRLVNFPLHMSFGLVMGLNIGKAKYRSLRGQSGGGSMFLAFFLPVLWHTLFDSVTGFNAALNAEDEGVQAAGMIIGLVVVAVTVVLQFVLFRRFRKNSEQYCAMEFAMAEV